MRKLLIATGALVVITVGGVVALPMLVPADRIKDEVAAQVKAATGRDLTIGGDVSVSVLPSLAVEVADVTLSNPPGFTSKDMLRLESLAVRLKVMPLLSGSVEIDSFVLVKPVITVETNRKGRSNLDFAATPPAAKDKPGSGSAQLADLKLGEVAIQNGSLVLIDGTAGTREEFTDLDLTVELDSLDSPLAAKGGVTWRGQPVDFNLDVAEPRAVMAGKTSPAALGLSGKLIDVSFNGDADLAGAKGDLDLSVSSVRDLMAWVTGQAPDVPGAALGPFTLAGQLTAGGGKVALAGSTITLDAIKAAGDLAVSTGGARPAVRGKLAVERLDLNPYLPPADAAAPATGQAAPAARPDWSDAPIDTAALKAADVDVALSVDGMRIREIEIGKSVLHLALVGGRLTADLRELALYEGAGSGQLTLDGRQKSLGLEAAFRLQNLQAAPFLTAAAGFDRIEGTGSADIAVSGRGTTGRQLIQSLNGQGAVTFLDGAIRGINLAAMVRNVTTAFAETSGAQKTDFAELSGTYTIANGIVTNDDLALKSPLLRMEGTGTVDLPQRGLRYRLVPKVVASIEGQGGKADLGGLTVPIIVEGPWDRLSYRPDLGDAVKERAQRALQDVIGDRLPALPGMAPTEPAASPDAQAAPAPAEPMALPALPAIN